MLSSYYTAIWSRNNEPVYIELSIIVKAYFEVLYPIIKYIYYLNLHGIWYEVLLDFQFQLRVLK